MNISKCIDSEIGTMIAAYELKLLTDEEDIGFEQHLLQCDYCFAKVKSFEGVAKALRDKSEVKEIVSLEAASLKTKVTKLDVLRAYLWPKFPLLLKPAVLLVFVVALLFPAWNGLILPDGDSIKQVETISLVPIRSSSDFASVSKLESLVIKFVYQGAIPGKGYMVSLTNERNEIVFNYDSFRGFDKFGSASLMVPTSILSSGNYELKITDPEVSGQMGQQTYYFGLLIE